jgi:mannose-6-phosphate isomerase-like protein (cupin superfamily)
LNLSEKLSKFSEHWKVKIIARMNDYHFKVVKLQGEFVWHKHDDTDEVFVVLDGEMSIAFKNGSVLLNQVKSLLFQKVLIINLLLRMNVK